MFTFNLKKILNKYNVEPIGVVHVGASWGQEYYLYRYVGFKKMLFFEPLRKIYEKLNKRFLNNENVNCINCALGNSNEKVKMYVATNQGQSSSILKPKHHLNKYPKINFPIEEIVQLKKMDSLDINLNLYNTMTIDTQGYELEVLKGSIRTLVKIKLIITEVNRVELYERGVMINDLDLFLKDAGFSRTITHWCDKNFGNAIYIKK